MLLQRSGPFRTDRAGYTVLYVPDAEVYHLIRSDHLNGDWFRQRFYWQGRSEGLIELLHFGKKHVLKTLPDHIARSIFGGDRYDRLHHRGFVTAILLNLFRPKLCGNRSGGALTTVENIVGVGSR